MLTIVYLLSVITLIFTSVREISGEDTLKAVQIYYRHGDRNPLKSYPTDQYSDLSNWPGGWGALTYNGKLKLFNLGKYMRQRYPQILKENVVAFSSDKNRAILSGMANLAGFSGQNKFILYHLEQMNQSLFNLQVIPSNEDDMIFVGQPCEKYKQLWNDLITNSEIVKELGEKYKYVFDTINENIGHNYTPFETDAMYLIDTVLIEEGRHLEMPEWINNLYHSGDLSKINGVGFALMLYTPEMKRLRTGRLFKKYFDQMDVIIKEDSSSNQNISLNRPKMSIFSGHDFTMVNWLVPLELYGERNSPFASALFIELHKSDGDRYFVKVYYKNETDSEPYLMTIPQCPNPCSYELLKIILTPLIVKDRQAECKLHNETIMSTIGLEVPSPSVSKVDIKHKKNASSTISAVSFSMMSFGILLMYLKSFFYEGV